MASASVAPRFRRDLVATSVEADGVHYVEVRDPATGTSFRFYDFEHSVALALDGRPLEAVSADLMARFGMELSPEQVRGFAAELGQLGFLEEDAPAAQPAALAPATGTAPWALSGTPAAVPPRSTPTKPVAAVPPRSTPTKPVAVVPPRSTPTKPVGVVSSEPGALPSTPTSPLGTAPWALSGATTPAPFVPKPPVPKAPVAITPTPAPKPVVFAPEAPLSAVSPFPPAPDAVKAPPEPAPVAPTTPPAPVVSAPPAPPPVAATAPAPATFPLAADLPLSARTAPPFPLAVTPSPLAADGFAGLVGREPSSESATPPPLQAPVARVVAPLGPASSAPTARLTPPSLPVATPPPAAFDPTESLTPPLLPTAAPPGRGRTSDLPASESPSPEEAPTPPPAARPVLRIVASNSPVAAPPPPVGVADLPRLPSPVIGTPLPPPPIDRHALGLDDQDPPPVLRHTPALGVTEAVPPPPRKHTGLLLVALLLVAGAAVGLGALAFRVPVNTEPPPVAVKVIVPAPTSVYRWFDAVGRLTPGMGPTLEFGSAGRVAEIAPPGKRFEAGEVIGLLDAGKRLRLDLDHERGRLKAYEDDLAKYRAAGNRPEVRQAEIKIERKKALLQKLTATLNELALIPSAPGEVAETLVSPGDTVAAHAPGLRLRGKAVRAEFVLSRDDARAARQLGFCRIEVDGASIDCTPSITDGDDTRLVLDLPAHEKAVVGGSAKVARARFDAVFVIPPSALVRGANGPARVFVASPSGRAEARPVTIADRDEHEVVVSQGIDVGDQVIVAPPADLRPDARVAISSTVAAP